MRESPLFLLHSVMVLIGLSLSVEPISSRRKYKKPGQRSRSSIDGGNGIDRINFRQYVNPMRFIKGPLPKLAVG